MKQPVFKTLDTQRTEAEFDLLNATLTALRDAGVSQDRIAYYEGCEEIQQIKNLTLPQQQYVLTRFWEMQLMFLSLTSTDFDTQPHRYVLSASQDTGNWMTSFRNHVVPLCISTAIPTSASAIGLFRSSPAV